MRILAKGEILGAREEQAPPLPLTLRPFYAIMKPTTRKGGIIMKKADVHIIVAMLATLVSMFTVMAMMFMRFFG